MCFKKPKLPQPSPEEKRKEEALEKELEAARANRKRELAGELRSEKDAQTEAALARALGFVGNRSLIAGPKGGAGFMGHGSGRVGKPVKGSVNQAPPASILPPQYSPNPIAGGGGSTPPLIHYQPGGGGGGFGGSWQTMVHYR